MTIESFLLALTRMMSKRGKIDVIWLDNLKSLENSDKALQQCWEVVSSDATLAKVEGSGIREKPVKTPLKKSLGRAMLTEEEMRTTLTEVEAQIHIRSSDTSDPLPFTSAEIIIGRLLLTMALKTKNMVGNSRQNLQALKNCKSWRIAFGNNGHKSM